MQKYNATSDINEALNPNNQKDFDRDSVSSLKKTIGRGFTSSSPIMVLEKNTVFKVLLLLRPVNQNGAVISVSQEILMQYELNGLLELRRAMCKTKFKYKAFVVDCNILVYDIDVKVASYQDIVLGMKKINQQDYNSDSFLNYYNDVLTKKAIEMKDDEMFMFDFEYIKTRTIEREREELSNEWCALDHLIANSLSGIEDKNND